METTEPRTRVGREEWRKRVERWRDSGLTCAEFAAELGVNARTLTYWKWVFDREARGEKRVWSRKRSKVTPEQPVASGASPSTERVSSGLIEVHAASQDGRFELELGAGRRLRVPASFDAAELRRLLEVLEAS
jgi:hypothetical protein